MFNLNIDANLQLINSDEELLKLFYHYKYNQSISVNIDFKKELREYKKSKVNTIKNDYEQDLANSDLDKFIRVKEIDLNSKMNYEVGNIIDIFLSNNSISILFDEIDIFLKDKCESLRNTISYYMNTKLGDYKRENIDCYIDDYTGFSFALSHVNEIEEVFTLLDAATYSSYKLKVTELSKSTLINIVVPAYTYFLAIDCNNSNYKDTLVSNIDKINDLSKYYIGYK